MSRVRATFDLAVVRRVLLLIVAVAALGGVAAAGALGLSRLDAHVDQLILAERPGATVTYVDMPELVRGLAQHDLNVALGDIATRNWTDAALCREMAQRLESCGWVKELDYVRRTAAGRFEISAEYRIPVALVHIGGDFFLVSAGQVRLPGIYSDHPAWKTIDRVASSPPDAGSVWEAEDLRAGLDVLAVVRGQPFENQIRGVDVGNFRGRRDARAIHLELVTDQPEGRIRWGSAPGWEVEENLVDQKIALLLGNYSATGRVDASHAVIDISTFPDRFTIPG